jgi:hypothetical protein
VLLIELFINTMSVSEFLTTISHASFSWISLASAGVCGRAKLLTLWPGKQKKKKEEKGGQGPTSPTKAHSPKPKDLPLVLTA